MSTLRQAFNTASPIGYGFMGTVPYPSGTPYQFAPPANLYTPYPAVPCAAQPAFTDDRYVSASADGTDLQYKPSYLRVLGLTPPATHPSTATPVATSLAAVGAAAAAVPAPVVTYTPLNTQLAGDQLYAYCTQSSGPCGSRPDSGSNNPCTDYGTCVTECYQNQRVPTCGGSSYTPPPPPPQPQPQTPQPQTPQPPQKPSTAPLPALPQAAAYSNIAWRAGTTTSQKNGICTASCQLLGQGSGDYTGCDGPSCYAKCTKPTQAQIPTSCLNPAYQQYLAGVEGGSGGSSGGGGGGSNGGSGGSSGSASSYPPVSAAALIAAVDTTS